MDEDEMIQTLCEGIMVKLVKDYKKIKTVDLFEFTSLQIVKRNLMGKPIKKPSIEILRAALKKLKSKDAVVSAGPGQVEYNGKT